jgi:hypothetical protein
VEFSFQQNSHNNLQAFDAYLVPGELVRELKLRLILENEKEEGGVRAAQSIVDSLRKAPKYYLRAQTCPTGHYVPISNKIASRH